MREGNEYSDLRSACQCPISKPFASNQSRKEIPFLPPSVHIAKASSHESNYPFRTHPRCGSVGRSSPGPVGTFVRKRVPYMKQDVLSFRPPPSPRIKRRVVSLAQAARKLLICGLKPGNSFSSGVFDMKYVGLEVWVWPRGGEEGCWAGGRLS